VSVPTHRASCQTWMYPTQCWYCRAPIHVLQCTCGSAVLFDYPRPPWQEHDCSGGIGGSGFSGWAAVDVLRSRGIPITRSVLNKVFPRTATGKATAAFASEEIGAVKPKAGICVSLLAVLRDVRADTTRIRRVTDLGDLGAKFLNLPKGSFEQITLVDNRSRPNGSYTCILPQRLGLPKSAKNRLVFAEIEGRGAGESAV
jgi:hypothetical protein